MRTGKHPGLRASWPEEGCEDGGGHSAWRLGRGPPAGWRQSPGQLTAWRPRWTPQQGRAEGGRAGGGGVTRTGWRAREGRAREAGPQPQGLQGDGVQARRTHADRNPTGCRPPAPGSGAQTPEGLLQGRGVGTLAWAGWDAQRGPAGWLGPQQHPRRACSVQSPEQRGPVYQGEKTGSPRLCPPLPPAPLPETWVSGAWGRESGHCPPAFPGHVVARG